MDLDTLILNARSLAPILSSSDRTGDQPFEDALTDGIRARWGAEVIEDEDGDLVLAYDTPSQVFLDVEPYFGGLIVVDARGGNWHPNAEGLAAHAAMVADGADPERAIVRLRLDHPDLGELRG